MEIIKEELKESEYAHSFDSRNRKSSVDPSPEGGGKANRIKTSFVKFREVKYIQSYDFDTVESKIICIPLKESKAPKNNVKVRKKAFSLQNTCFEKIENKLIYGTIQAFPSNLKELTDRESLEFIKGIYKNPSILKKLLDFSKIKAEFGDQ